MRIGQRPPSFSSHAGYFVPKTNILVGIKILQSVTLLNLAILELNQVLKLLSRGESK